ncbi:MAG: hypothetical protein IJS01_00450 [Lentisphaeria bacterium]|nr:hypothetical protein [Lentisphaeria bacterium]
MKLLCIASAATAAASLLAVEMKESKADRTISNKYYTLTVDNAKGTLKSLSFGGKKYLIYGSQEFRKNGEQKTYTGQTASVGTLYNGNNSRQKVSVVSRSADRIELACELAKPFAKSRLVYTFDDTPVIRCRMEAEFTEAPSDWFYTLRLINFAAEKGVFLLPGKTSPGVPFDWAYYAPGSGWQFAYSPGNKGGLGLVTGNNCQGMEYYLNREEEGFNALACLRVIPSPLRRLTGKNAAECTFSIIAGSLAEREVFAAVNGTGMVPEVGLTLVETAKLMVKPGEKNAVSTVISNASDREKKLRVEVFVETKLADVKKVFDGDVAVPARGAVPFECGFETCESMRGGAAVRVVLSENGKQTASRSTAFAVSDFAPESVRFAFVNVGSCHQKGSEEVWSDFLKRNKIGIIEYYLWMRSTVRGITPEEENWRPMTESPVYYRHVMSKTFIQNFVKRCKDKGVNVISSITGLYNYKEALKEPEQILYCENGQPSIYNGLIYGNKERAATFKVHGYTKEFVDAWAKDMIKSCEMFGWQGYRFDWYFIPDAPNDPLYLNTPSPDWRDMYGKTGKEYYPDPDKTAVERLTQYRAIMEKNVPGFIYATNIHANAKSQKRNPGYLKAATRKALLIYEYMLGLTRKPLHTFKTWSAALAEDVQRARVNGGQPTVAFALLFPSDSVSGNLIQYLTFAAGAKHGGSVVPVRDQYVRDNFMTRYSEYYFSPEFLRLPEAERKNRFALAPAYNVFFEPFTCSREKGAFREETLHLVNLPETGDEISRTYERVPVRKDLTLTVTPRKGEKIAEAFAAVPQKEAPVKLAVSGNEVKLPELDDAMIVVLRYAK